MVDLYIVKVIHGQKLLNAQFHHGAVFTIIRVHDNLTDRRFFEFIINIGNQNFSATEERYIDDIRIGFWKT